MESNMATWGVHLRLARKFMDKLDESHWREFVIGSVAPDCGYGKKDSVGEFNPPPVVTHWSPSGTKRDCRYKGFYSTYLTGERNDDYWFYLGYYIHLMTDIMWSATMYAPTRVKYAEEYKKNPEFLKVIKKDWNDIDVEYLRRLSDRKAYNIIKNAGNVKDYLPYYEKGQLTKQIKFIADYYEQYPAVEKREYIYTKPEEMQNFVDCAYELLNMIIENDFKKLAQVLRK